MHRKCRHHQGRPWGHSIPRASEFRGDRAALASAEYRQILTLLYLQRKLVAIDVACQPAGGKPVSSRRDAWDILDVRLKADYKQHESDAARTK